MSCFKTLDPKDSVIMRLACNQLSTTILYVLQAEEQISKDARLCQNTFFLTQLFHFNQSKNQINLIALYR